MSPAVTAFRLLTFRITRTELAELDMRHLALGLTATWVVGMGRYWNDPGAEMLQTFGLGSVIYVFGLAAILWVFVKPLLIEGWTCFTVSPLPAPGKP